MKEVYFPMEVLRVTQGYGVVHDNVAADTYSHKGTYALDLGGADTGADWLVAPFACTVKRVYGTYNAVWFESDEVYEPIGCKLIMLCLHMNSADLKALGIAAGKHFALGERCYREGRAGNVTGTHVHLEIGKGSFTGTGWHQNASGVWEINNKLIPSDVFRLCTDVKILDGHGYAWQRRTVEKPLPAQLCADAVRMACVATGADKLPILDKLDGLGIAYHIDGNSIITDVAVTAGDQRSLLAVAPVGVVWKIYTKPAEQLKQPEISSLKPSEDEQDNQPAEEEKTENSAENAGEIEPEQKPLTKEQQAVVDLIALAQAEAEENAAQQKEKQRKKK